MENSKIEWTDHTFNPWIGCTKVSPACDHCYAEALMKRYGKPELWAGERQRTSAANWKKPLSWNRQAAAARRRYRVFCASLADVFDNQVPDEWRADLWLLISATPNLDWLLLTKRPQNIAKMLPRMASKPGMMWPWPNVWLGTTVENQQEERRIDHLRKVPAAVRFLSCEPLLEKIHPDLTGIHLVIAGGESGPGWRPTPDGAFDYLRAQCEISGAAFFMKQMPNKAPIPHHLMTRQFPERAS